MSNRICVFGLWHLGSVTAACLASLGMDVIGLDPSSEAIAALRNGKAPLFEPELDDLIAAGLASRHLRFTDKSAEALQGCDTLWVTFDTPVDESDRADSEFVIAQVEALFPYLPENLNIIISSQLPVGSTRRLSESFSKHCHGRRKITFAYSPENLRLGAAIEVFLKPGRIVVGTFDEQSRLKFAPLMETICDSVVWMTVESAEMVKHATNSFLATSIVLTNEIASLCEAYGADAASVELALRKDPRIGPRAYVRAGPAFGGGTLARDVRFLSALALEKGLEVPVLNHVLKSNDSHRRWAQRHLATLLQSTTNAQVCVLGLAYKPGTDAIRRSYAIELCEWLVGAGYQVTAFDPQVRSLPSGPLSKVRLYSSAREALSGSHATIVATEWPEFRSLVTHDALQKMERPLILDAGGFLQQQLAQLTNIQYISVGRKFEA